MRSRAARGRIAGATKRWRTTSRSRLQISAVIGMLRASPRLLGGSHAYSLLWSAWAIISPRHSPIGGRVVPCRRRFAAGARLGEFSHNCRRDARGFSLPRGPASRFASAVLFGFCFQRNPHGQPKTASPTSSPRIPRPDRPLLLLRPANVGRRSRILLPRQQYQPVSGNAPSLHR